MNIWQKGVAIIALGWLVWSLGLVWPEINFGLILAVAAAIALVAASMGLVSYWWDHHHQNQTHRPQPRQPSRPVTVH